MKKVIYIALLGAGLSCCGKGWAQNYVLPYKVKYIQNKNPFYPTSGCDILEKITSTPVYGAGFVNSVTASASQQTVVNTAIPQIQTFYVSFDSATVDPTLNYTLSATPPSGAPSTASRTIDVKAAPKGTFFIISGTRSTIYYLVGVPQPTISMLTPGTQFCPDDMIHLSASVWGTSGSGVHLTWYFYVGNSSDTTMLTYVANSIGTSDINFSANSIPALASVVNGLTANTNINFYCIASGDDDKSVRSVPISIGFSPPPPAVGSYTATDACGTGNTGSIQLSNITGMNSYAYVLLDASASQGGCDPTNPTSCNNVESSDKFTGNSYTISNVLPKQYNLMVANYNVAGTAGACRTTIPVLVNSIPALTQTNATHTDISCPGGNDGSITVTTSGGKSGTVSYQLVSQPSGTVLVNGQPSGVFTGLSAGAYTVKVTDGCGTTLTPAFTLIQPAPVSGSFAKTDATCGSPGNGQLTTNVNAGSGTYNYYLYLNGTLIGSQPGSINTSWQVADLAPGSYSLQVLDAAAPGCSGYTATVTIGGPPALGLSVLSTTAPTCNGASTGSLSLQGSGAMGTYQYSITNTGISQTYTNNTGSFASLAAGNYTAVVQSGVSGCTDAYTYGSAIMISQPPAITIGLSPSDVQCYGQQNGSITASLSGGTGTLTPAWQQQTAGLWSVISGTTTTLSSLPPGAYRLSVTDANSCNTTSLPVTIGQPAALSIPSVALTDIVCYGGSGTITPMATGGNGGNVFAYSADGGSNYTPFTPGAFFPAGSYLIEVTDSKGCQTSYTQAQVITAPPSVLSFTDALSNYNGYNISCYGATTGWVTATPTGGNGGTYSGYNFSVDGGAYQSSPTLNNLTAGLHTIRIEDGRGCVVNQTETLTQPATALSLSLQTETDNDCADGQTGLLSISATGGAAPYQFSIDGGSTYQNGGSFSGLATGAYTITAMDQNGCRLSGNYSIASLYPAITMNAAIQAVSCNGGTNGAITLAVNGGSGGYTYQWSDLSDNGQTALPGTGPLLTTLKAGAYRALITDAKGCTAADTSTVSQPSPLTASLSVHPVCANAASGTITIQAGGGTPPYQYTSNSVYQSNPLLSNLSAGNYTVYVMDNHGCTWKQDVTVTTNGLSPSINFLVSTQQNALDTLQVEDVSEPKPDSVQWSFDPLTILLGSNAEGPLIRYAQPGAYPVTMQAFYGGCDFAATQQIVIQPYDPNATSPQVIAGLSFDSVLLAPNPNNGTFNLYVKLYKAQRMTLTITSLSGQRLFTKQWSGQQLISEQVALPSNVVSGAYIAELVTETDVRDYNIIVTK